MTSELRQAREDLHEAIRRVIELERQPGDREDCLLTQWIVVTAEVEPGETPEDDTTGFTLLMPNATIPWHHAEGLLRAGIRQLRLSEVHLRGDDD